ncbi:BZ3500_MvSof-1268-A1-R1_Chr1-1g00999 [Microbotryum saponariae]|uniref:BZ3500_MvSof-1268-A1-R1_Chr1-1g00999 protein n=1 Tax=Microbotryum saponariae TaxID=289078 RepID=A0A2X0K7Z7_9BASI|nr:BZ3500_MvSof-1268-A1-R1_Chr1-1g00999 [Microbotryum saponariae]SCZ93140.1 BZ3501_MvSof-1269-A2-R1_Chr1-1g00596 [Microbotryum saponariae]
MRDLAASFSSRRSPNHRHSTTQSKKDTTSAQDLFARTSLESPRKYNPFAREGTTASPTKRIKLSGGEESLKRSSVRLGQLFGAARRRTGGAVEEDDDDDDQEMLGESPVKHDATKGKSFVPLFDHDEDEEHEGGMKNPFLASGADGKGNGKRKKNEESEPGKKGGAMDGWLRKAVHPTLKGVKRTGYEGAELVQEDEDEDGGDKGEGSSAGTNGQKGKKKPKRAPAGPRYKKIPGGKALPKKGSTAMAVDPDSDDDDEAASDRIGKTSRVGSMLIVDLDDEEQHRIVIRSTGEGIGGAGMSKTEEGEEDELVLATGSLIYVRGTPPPSTSIPITSMGEDAPTWLDQDQANEALPEDLASILSLRSSPMKKTASKRMLARNRTVDDLLKGPSAGVNRVKKGLMDLEDEEADKVVEEGAGSDDDWASDVEGWKAVSDGEMDGYEEVEALGRM